MVHHKENSLDAPVRDQKRHTRSDTHGYSSFKIQRLESHDFKNSKNSKTSNKTVSAADVFKKSRSMRRERKRHHAQATYETPIINVLEDQMSEVGNDIAKDGLCTFDEALSLHLRILDSVKKEDQKATEMISTAITMLTTPLSLEPENVDNSDSDPHTQTSSNFIAKYVRKIKIEQENLEKCWKQWYDIQNEYTQLYIDVFGQESSGQSVTHHESKFKSRMEMLDLEKTSDIADFEEEINRLSVQTLQKMRKSEKELDAAMKKEKTRLLTSLVSNL
ncbi:hypothetical protein GcM3_223013 [Golovinomyces cichoracearum]|uniref:Uncharacterized protein n=1 Tax=Golovinomyces cichoracearum TaxID=62708 RepID=A0A420GWZ1_9PEZI|nr:hypothetical protein GcM3_223013 [Golovinomyces cichoracearum]